MSLYREVRAGAREWWFHQRLRDGGEIAEARKREHQSTRSTVRHIRLAIENGGFLTLGRGGYTLHYGDEDKGNGLKFSNCTVSGHGCDNSHTVRAAILAGVLTIDTRTIPDARIFETAKMPMGKPGLKAGRIPAFEREPIEALDPAGWLDYVPPADLARRYASIGATVHNLERV